jgi:hypothetical protein
MNKSIRQHSHVPHAWNGELLSQYAIFISLELLLLTVIAKDKQMIGYLSMYAVRIQVLLELPAGEINTNTASEK